MLELLSYSGWIGWAIVILFGAAIVIFVERWWCYRQQGREIETFVGEFETALQDQNPAGLLAICGRYRNLMAGICRLAVEFRDRGPASVRNILHSHIDLQAIPKLRARLGLLGTIGKAAPLLGLLGTVSGMMKAFAQIAGTSGQGVDPKDLARNIGEALGTTFLGLCVALPVAFALTYLRAKAEKFEVDLEQYSQRCLDRMFPSES